MAELSTFLGNWCQLSCVIPHAQIFAIGDVHGQAGALATTLEAIASVPDCGAPRRLIFLGDLIDRGPDSLGSVRLASEAAERARVDDVVLLPGNHELMLLDGLLNPQAFIGDWLDNGGDEVIREFDSHCRARKLVDLAEIARTAFPSSFLSQMAMGPTFHREGNLLFVHAGLAPGADPDIFLSLGRFGASGMHWAWIREPFLSWTNGWGPDSAWLVVHGHTPAVSQPTELADFQLASDQIRTHRRLCLDAGAAYGLAQVGWAEFSQGRYRIGLTSAVT